jgi:hypothetical protein
LRKPGVRVGIGVAATLIVTVAVILTLQLTDGAKAVSDNAALIAALVALGGVFTTQLVSISLDDRRAEETRRIEGERAREARDLEAQRAHESALQNYFEDVGNLLIEKPLREAKPRSNLSTVVRAHTLSVLEGLDPERKRILLMFLYESELIRKDNPVVSLLAANLRGVNLSRANLRDANLSGAFLTSANLYRVNLVGANLRGANLRKADLTEAYLSGADLHKAYVGEADLSDARLSGVDLSNVNELTKEQLDQAGILDGAILPDGS